MSLRRGSTAEATDAHGVKAGKENGVGSPEDSTGKGAAQQPSATMWIQCDPIFQLLFQEEAQNPSFREKSPDRVIVGHGFKSFRTQ